MMGCVGLGLEFVVFCLEKEKDWERLGNMGKVLRRHFMAYLRTLIPMAFILSIGGCWTMGEFSGKGHISIQTGGRHESIFSLPLPAQGPLPVHLLAPIHCVSRKPRC